MKDLSNITNKQLMEIAAKVEKKLEKKEEKEPEDTRILESIDRLINAVRALHTEPPRIMNQPKIVMPDVSPTINVQPADVTVPHQIMVHPAKVDVTYPEAPKKWKFNIKRQGTLITEITAEVVK